MTPAGAVYEGWVSHRRFRPRRHGFRYRVGMIYVDLDQLPELLERPPWWSARRPAPAWFRRADYLRPTDRPLDEAVRDLVAERTGERPTGSIRLLTHPRYWGYGFNPVSFYYVFEAEGSRPRWVVADVSNTPWNERHSYLLGPLGETDGAGNWRPECRKVFHVSPFMPMDQDYRWLLRPPGDSLLVNIANHDGAGRIFHATLSLRRRPLTTANLNRLLWRYPWLSLKIIAGIHWQALRLWLKGVPYVPHPEERERASS
jgi:DUF1365 family protein